MLPLACRHVDGQSLAELLGSGLIFGESVIARAIRSFCLLPLCLATVTAYAQPPADVEDLVGARAAGGETQMQARGYSFVRVNTVRDQKWSFWWNERTQQCASISTMDGRYAAINKVPAANCDRQEGPQASASAAPQSQEEHLSLICWGEGQKTTVESKSGLEWNAEKRKYESSSRIENGKSMYNAQLGVEIQGQHGRIKLAGALVAPIHSGGQDGWWELEDLRIDRELITGRYRMNGLNKPTVRIDRRIGRITISGMENFAGACEDAARASDRPRF